MPITVLDEGESRDRRLALLLQTANSLQAAKQNREENELRRQALAQNAQENASQLGLRRAQQSSLLAQARMYNQFSKTGGAGMFPGAGSVDSGMQFDPEDYMMEQTMRNVRGIPQQMAVPKLKPEVDKTARDQITAFRSTVSNTANNLKMIDPDIEKFMNPLDPRAKRGGIGDFILKLQSISSEDARKFKTFKAETDKVFQEFRKDTTGAQAALKELGWLSPDFPEADDSPKLYIRKAVEAIKRIAEGEQLLLGVQKQSGRRTSGLMKESLANNPAIKELIETGGLPTSGKIKSGMGFKVIEE